MLEIDRIRSPYGCRARVWDDVAAHRGRQAWCAWSGPQRREQEPRIINAIAGLRRDRLRRLRDGRRGSIAARNGFCDQGISRPSVVLNLVEAGPAVASLVFSSAWPPPSLRLYAPPPRSPLSLVSIRARLSGHLPVVSPFGFSVGYESGKSSQLFCS